MNTVKIGDILVGDGQPFVLFAGPCVIEDETLTREIAAALQEITTKLNIPFVFKASYDKANRTSLKSYRGPGIGEGLRILGRIGADLGLPIITDVHRFEDIPAVCEFCDVVQVPAFLCRQTDFIMEIARCARVVNIKKGQFLAPADVRHIIDKAQAAGSKNIIITERGVSFGYNNLVTDIRAFPIMRAFGYPVVFDATHSVQLPAACGGASGGDREMAPYLCRAAVAAGIDGIFLETHPQPERALCDGQNSVALESLPRLLAALQRIDKITKEIMKDECKNFTKAQ